MISRIQKAKESEGFTLIELLVVMIIIGILAAIAIPLFLNQRAKAAETAAKADATAIGKEIMAFYVDGTGATDVDDDGAGTWSLNQGGASLVTGSLSGQNTATGTGADASTWCVTVDPSATNADAQAWEYDSVTGLALGTC